MGAAGVKHFYGGCRGQTTLKMSKDIWFVSHNIIGKQAYGLREGGVGSLLPTSAGSPIYTSAFLPLGSVSNAYCETFDHLLTRYYLSLYFVLDLIICPNSDQSITLMYFSCVGSSPHHALAKALTKPDAVMSDEHRFIFRVTRIL